MAVPRKSLNEVISFIIFGKPEKELNIDNDE